MLSMSSLRSNPNRVLLVSQERPIPPGGQSMLIRRYRLARLRPENKVMTLSTRVEQTKRRHA